MGPEKHERVSEDLMQAVTCLRRVMTEMKSTESEETPAIYIPTIGTLAQLTGALERCMENSKAMSEVLSGKMKCTTCGATSVGLFPDCHDSATSTTTTISHRSSEEPPRHPQKHDDVDDDVDEVCSSIGSRSIRSVSSSVQADDDNENNQTMTATETTNSEEQKPEVVEEEEEEEHDLIMKTILSTATSSAPLISNQNPRKPRKKSLVPPPPPATSSEDPVTDTALLDQFLQSSLLGFSPDILNGVAESPEAPESAPAEENDGEKTQSQLLNNFFQLLFAQQQQAEAANNQNEDSTSSSSSQPSPPTDQNALESLAMIESLFADNNPNLDGTPSADLKAAARKRKSTPMKVPKTENGAGYICPMDGCNKVFKEKGSVHRHFVTHIGMRFNCDKCKASYTQKHALMLHQKIHSNPDAYQCRGCGTNYTTQNGLRLHRQRNPTCMELANAVEFNTSLNASLSKNASPTKQMVLAAP